MPARYAPLPNPRSDAQDADAEMDAAFESEDEDDRPTRPMLSNRSATPPPPPTPGAYNFEYDYPPPPGSPPRPSALAIPNNYGNSNGILPTDAVEHPQPRVGGWWTRTVGSILPTHYRRLPTSSGPRGGGTENDGVFANVMAKPGGSSGMRRTEDAEGIHISPEETQKEAPPSYATAQADAVPPYWETTILAPSNMTNAGELIIDSLPTGSLFSFLWNLLVSLSFQWVGFLLCMLLATTHAARYGSRAGLGVTLIQYGFYLRTSDEFTGGGAAQEQLWPWQAPPPTPTHPEFASAAEADAYFSSLSAAGPSPTAPADAAPAPYPNGASPFATDLSTADEWLSFFLMTIGWFVLLTSLLGYWRVKRWERSIQSANAGATPMTAQEIERDNAVRLNIERAFGLSYAPEPIPETDPRRAEAARRLDDRLQADLRAAGLL